MKVENPLAFAAAAGDEFLQKGMTLRDYFAGKAIIASPHNAYKFKENAEYVYELADAMLKARMKPIKL